MISVLAFYHPKVIQGIRELIFELRVYDLKIGKVRKTEIKRLNTHKFSRR